MMDAWFSASVMMASSSPSSGSNTPAVGVEAGGVQDGVLRAEEGGDLALQFLVDVLRAADEAHRRQAEAAAVDAPRGRP